MTRFLLLLLGMGCGSPAAAAPPSEPAEPSTGPIRQAYEAVRDGGCGSALSVWTPVEARILRNTPFAIAGFRFDDDDLRAVFDRDGRWYLPTVSAPPPLSSADSACVARLAEREAALRATWALPVALEARMIRDPALFQVLRQWSSAANPYGKARFERTADGTWRLGLVAADCDPVPGADCAAYVITCPAEGACEAVAAG